MSTLALKSSWGILPRGVRPGSGHEARREEALTIRPWRVLAGGLVSVIVASVVIIFPLAGNPGARLLRLDGQLNDTVTDAAQFEQPSHRLGEPLPSLMVPTIEPDRLIGPSWLNVVFMPPLLVVSTSARSPTDTQPNAGAGSSG